MYRNAVTDKRGTFKQDDWGLLMLKITDFDGTPIDPETITVSIVIGSQTVDFDSDIPMQVDDGCYVFQWEVEEDQEIGEYFITWTFNIDGVDYEESQTVVVKTKTASASADILYDERVMAFREGLENLITCVQQIPVYYEQAKPSRNNQKYYFSFPRWNQSNRVKIYRNGKIINEGCEINYFKGSVTFDEPLLTQETIHADYDFRWLKDEEIDQFLNNAVQAFNSFPPYSTYSLRDVPTPYMSAILYGASKDALRNMMMSLLFQEPQQVFGGKDEADKAFSNMDKLKMNYEKDWDKLTEQKKYGKYPKMYMVVVPEYTLPGGRCLHPDTELLVIVNNRLIEVVDTNNYSDVYTNRIITDGGVVIQERENKVKLFSEKDIKTYTVKEIYELFNKGFNIDILSQNDITGEIVFSPVNYIWESGTKTIYNLETENGHNVQTSDEHLFYVNREYLPLKEIKVGDEIVTCDDYNWEYTTVKSITKIKKKIKMYDLEVKTTANLFANGIKCHNSRWFRYLFKILVIGCSLSFLFL